MRRIVSLLAFAAILMTFNLSCDELLDDSSSQETQQHVPQPYTHDALQYKVKVRYYVNYTYTPKDTANATDELINEFEKRLETDGNNGYGYELAEGETPNLTLNITVNSDNSNNMTMQVNASVSDDTFNVHTDNSYQDFYRMIDAMADSVNAFVSEGWHGTR
jgi:hypothetical protein